MDFLRTLKEGEGLLMVGVESRWDEDRNPVEGYPIYRVVNLADYPEDPAREIEQSLAQAFMPMVREAVKNGEIALEND